MTVLLRKSHNLARRGVTIIKNNVPVRRESFLAKLMGIQAIAPEIGMPLIVCYGVCVYGGVLYGIQNLNETEEQ